MKNKRFISDEEKINILLTFCEKKLGYKETHDFIDKVFEDYDPVEYAVIKADKELEKRNIKEC